MRPPNGTAPDAVSVTAIVTCMTDGEAPFVRSAVQSVREQTYPTILRLYVAEDNCWIEAMMPDLAPEEVRRIPLQNVASVRNLGVREAGTSHVAFLDGDDWWLPDKTERQLAEMRETGAIFAGGDHLLVDEAGKCFAFGLSRYLPITSSWLADRHYMLAFPFDESVETREDALWWVRMLRNPASKLRVPHFVVAYRLRMNSKSENTAPRRRKLFLHKITRKPLLRHAVYAFTFLLNATCRSNHYMPMRHWPEHPPPEPVASHLLDKD